MDEQQQKQQEKSWKQQKAERDAHANMRARQGWVHKLEHKPGAEITSLDGVTKYIVAKDGSRRKVK